MLGRLFVFVGFCARAEGLANQIDVVKVVSLRNVLSTEKDTTPRLPLSWVVQTRFQAKRFQTVNTSEGRY